MHCTDVDAANSAAVASIFGIEIKVIHFKAVFRGGGKIDGLDSAISHFNLQIMHVSELGRRKGSNFR